MNTFKKFRIWGKGLKPPCFIDPWRFEFCGRTWQDFLDKFQDNLYVFQQFTGLKDINNKEIYEGDIVNVYEYLNGQIDTSHKSIIIFNNGKFDIDTPWLHQSLERNEVEIIGNIYDNPSLLDD